MNDTVLERGREAASRGRARGAADPADGDVAGGVLPALQKLAGEARQEEGLLRNVAVALGNRGSPEAVPVLAAALNDEEPLIRGHSAWALGRIGGEAVRQASARPPLSLREPHRDPERTTSPPRQVNRSQ